MNRREFIKKAAALSGFSAGALLFGRMGRPGTLFAQDTGPADTDLVAVRNGEPDVMFDRGIAALGGMGSFVKRGDTVVLKPNMAWDRPAETGANTNPLLIRRVIEHIKEAGAKRIYVFDHTVSNWQRCYKNSGIEAAVKEAGGTLVPANSEKYYQKVTIPGGKTLKKTKVHELILDSDVFINIPILKHHSSTRLTGAMKNLMGMVWNRREFHSSGLNQCIADASRIRKPDLNILDAYIVTMKNGPGYAGPEDIVLKKNLLLGRDMVAVDTAGALIHGQEPSSIRYLPFAESAGSGTMNLDSLSIRRIAL